MNIKMMSVFVVGTSALLLLGGCGDEQKPTTTPSDKAATAAGTGTGAGASVSTGTDASAAVATSTGTTTGAADTKSENPPKESAARTKIGNGPHSIVLPASWKVENVQKPMRALTVTVPKEEGDADNGELSVFVFPGNAGGLDNNVKRWAGQFGGDNSIKAQRDVKTESGSTVKVVEIEGDFAGGMGAEPKANYKMLGSFVETADGAHVFKLVGPPKTLNKHMAEFDAMIESFK